MKKLELIFAILILVFSLTTNGQIIQDCNGNVGVGGVPSVATFTVRKETDAIIKFINGNNYGWNIGNWQVSPWGAPNTLTVSLDDTTPIMEFRQDGTYIHNRLVVGIGHGNIHRSRTGYGGQAVSYTFNPNYPVDAKGFLFESTSYESSGFYCDGDFAVIWSPGDYGYLLKVLDEDGMPFGTELKWYINGSGQAFTNSDKSRKENIESIPSSLEKIRNMRGVSYNFLRTEEEKLKNDSILNGTIAYKGNIDNYRKKVENKDFGFIANEIEEVIPEVVEIDENGNKFVNYDGIVPLLVQGMNEQLKIIESLQAEIQEIKKITSSDSKLKSATISYNTTDVQVNSMGQPNTLYQNAPNPFSQTTTIEYFLKDNIQKAIICIYDMNGTQLKCIALHLSGYGNITINGSELKAGMYMYSLIADGQLIDTKRMVLTD